ncbi:MAG: hypothetical protein A2137_04770 [Chloroflexi bacterium RBG_16_58_8]|nr:MAG: hypothetical protein A2137_04770 [Chloroflexi bacterium RBG_16_58_8]
MLEIMAFTGIDVKGPGRACLDTLPGGGYDATSMTVLVFLKDLAIATATQMASLFAGIFVFGLLIHFISHLTFKSLEKSFGSRGVYFVAWLGTPIHELGHALFCVIFLHKIAEIRFFKPDPLTGTLGYVYHKWSRTNPWQVLGNFFIGIGPVVLGCAVLFATFYFLVPDSARVWHSITLGMNGVDSRQELAGYLAIFRDASLSLVRLIFNPSHLAEWRFWVFLYLSICVASNIRLSPSDIKGALSGLGCIVLPFLLLNLVGLITGAGAGKFFPYTASSLGLVYSLLLLALVMVLVGFVLTYLVAAVYYRLKYRGVLSPF